MKIERHSYLGANNRVSLYELSSSPRHEELVLFIHGFMGFMDWGAWHLVRDYFTSAGYDFCRFNLSHNGGTNTNPIDFPDEAAFGQNTYSKELFDISSILNHLETEYRPYDKIHLIGHSRGGGMAILAAQQWQQISSLGQVCTWAAISDIERRFPTGEDLADWEASGVRFVKNGRTLQDLPQAFELYADYKRNHHKLDIKAAAKDIAAKLFIFHGDQDQSVRIEEGFELADVALRKVHIIEGADHVFGTSHPWQALNLPPHLAQLCQKTLEVFK